MSIEHDCLVRDGGRCFRCGADITRAPRDCHHREPKGMGGTPVSGTLENRIMLCGRGNVLGCHGYVHSSVRDAYRNGWLVRHDDDPARVPARHHDLGMVYLTAMGRVLPADAVVAWTADGSIPLAEGDVANLTYIIGAELLARG